MLNLYKLRPAKVLPLGVTFIFGGAGRARTYDDRIMSPGL